MSNWEPMGDCKFCDKPIEGRPATPKLGFTIKGAEPMEYRHTHDGSSECVVTRTYKVSPFRSWGCAMNGRPRGVKRTRNETQTKGDE